MGSDHTSATARLIPYGAAAIWAVTFAAIHAYWAAGGGYGLPGEVRLWEHKALLTADLIAIPLCLLAAWVAAVDGRNPAAARRVPFARATVTTVALLCLSHSIPPLATLITRVIAIGHARTPSGLMRSTASASRLSLPARLLHWLVAAAVATQISLGSAAEWEERRAESFQLIRTHYQLGVVIFGLMVMRLLWRIANTPPPPAPDQSRLARASAATVHWLLYTLLLTMPISGYVIWVCMDMPMDVLGIFELPRLFTPPVEDETGRALAWYVHLYSSWAVVGHVSAAVWHEFIRRDGTISARML